MCTQRQNHRCLSLKYLNGSLFKTFCSNFQPELISYFLQYENKPTKHSIAKPVYYTFFAILYYVYY